jgi:Integrase core domain
VERAGFGSGAGTTVRVAEGKPGEECQIDFAKMGLLYDPVAGRRRTVHALIFTAVFSRHMFVWLTFAQTLEAVVAGCESAWRFFGGVFTVLIPDNASAIVAQADALNPRFTAGWLEYAQARGFATDPARVRSPRDKPTVERAVQYVRGNCFAGEDFVDLADAQARAEAWCRDTAGQRVHGTTQARPAEVFAEHEVGLLLPVPEVPYVVPIYATVKVHRDFHVQVGKALYSAPKAYLGQQVQARADGELVKLFHRGRLIKTHPRQKPGGRWTDPEDLPRREGRLRDARPAEADHRRRRARHQCGYLRRAAARRQTALDQDAAGLPAARPGQTLRIRTGRRRLFARARTRRRQRHQDRRHARAGHREHPGTGTPGGAGHRSRAVRA